MSNSEDNIPWKVRFYEQDESDSDDWYFTTKKGAYQNAGQAIIEQVEYLENLLEETEKTPVLMGIVAQLYQDAKFENWESVFKIWKSISRGYLPNIVVRKEAPPEPYEYERVLLKSDAYEFIMEWIKQ